MNKFIVIGATIIIISLVIYYIYQQKHAKQTIQKNYQIRGSINPYQSKSKPVLILYKSGGFGDLIRRIEIDLDRTYRIYDQDKLIQEYHLNRFQSCALEFLLENYFNFKNKYCDESTGNDMLYYRLCIFDIEISLGDFDRKCVPEELYQNTAVIERILDAV